MGREKRLAESRARESMENRTKDAPRAPERTSPAPAATVTSSPIITAGTGTGKALFQILLLYALPVVLILLIGKLILKL